MAVSPKFLLSICGRRRVAKIPGDTPPFKGRVFKISKIVEKILKCFTWFGCFRIFKSAEMVKKLPNTKSLPLKEIPLPHPSLALDLDRPWLGTKVRAMPSKKNQTRGIKAMTATNKTFLFVLAEELAKHLEGFSASLVRSDNPLDNDVCLVNADGRKIIVWQEWGKNSRIVFSSNYDSLQSPFYINIGKYIKITVASDKSIEAIADVIKRRLLPDYTAAFEKWREIVAQDIEKNNAAIAGVKEIIFAAGRVPDPDTGKNSYRSNAYKAWYLGKNPDENYYTPSFEVSSYDGKGFDIKLQNISLEQAKLIAEAFLKDL
jgi:hypothetical protein